MQRQITDLKLTGDVWLIGKGPSLDTFNWDRADANRICINETVFLVPDPAAAIAIDYAVLDKYKERKLAIPIIKKETHSQYSFEDEYTWSPRQLKHGCMATAPIAIQLLAILGIKRIHFVGFDAIHGDVGYAGSIKGIDACGHSRDQYKKINEAILDVIVKTGIEPVWEFHTLAS